MIGSKSMKKTIILILVMILVVTGCANTKNKDKKDNKEELLTAEELIELTGISKEQYENIDLNSFIEDFGITKEDVETLNIERLLEEYPNSKVQDVSDLLDSKIKKRKSNFTKDVVAIAFLENIGTDNECVYYDLKEQKRYRASHLYIFSDLTQVEPESYSDGKDLIKKLDEQDVFSWENSSSNEEIMDAQFMTLAIEYEDGTVFRVSASGILSDLLPDSYETVKNILLN